MIALRSDLWKGAVRLMTEHNNSLEAFIKRPPSFATLATIVIAIFVSGVTYMSMKGDQDNLSKDMQNIKIDITSLRGRIDINAKSIVDLTALVNLLGSRVDAQAQRINGIDTEFAAMQRDLREAMRDQAATDKVIIDKLGVLDASVAAMRADLNWLTHLPIPPGTLGGRSADPPGSGPH